MPQLMLNFSSLSLKKMSQTQRNTTAESAATSAIF